VGILGTILLRVSLGTILPTFIEIGSYLTNEEQNISWHSFFETRSLKHSSPHNLFVQESLADAKVSARQQCVYKGP